MKCFWCGKIIEDVIGKAIAFCNIQCLDKHDRAFAAHERYGLQSKQLQEVLNE